MATTITKALNWTRKLALAAMLAAAAPPVPAQDLFAPRLIVGDRVITGYEVFQRALFLQVLRAPGDPETEALKVLTEEKLQLSEADRLGLTVSEEEVLQGMTEFAARASLSAEDLIGELEKVGISVETFRDFVAAGLLWRKAVRERFVGQVPVSNADIDRALEASSRPRALKLLLSELVIAAPPGQEQAAMELATRLSGEITSAGEFAAAARRYSASPTAGRGGALDWVALANLPGAIAGSVLALGEGDVSVPIVVPNAVVLFLLRDVARDETAEPLAVSVEYARLTIATDPDRIAAIRTYSDTCTDLNLPARGLPEEALVIETLPLSDIPADTALELAKLDPGETAVLSRGGASTILMLCKRQETLETPPTRDEVRERVINQKLEGMAAGYLQELRSAAIIREP